ncbi:PhzF family phenazine biosynthesis protein [Sphingomicrobium sediminis]|uniref:PhzF family phenazine biosynthesis protein n=1 Tax=Sphingomicrobium sediminis TaxID=2950949 RepID=A0A9X2EJ98_9SPHN|nr:PhzF family phenazine biosynthesis protein [Sphingomicrobium sediminis]MCM8558486.1 PhzF family phenazine biosynthesis protein [Sphingomicrobium sediminis]
MKRIPFTQVDAFTDRTSRLTGNPAAVMPLKEWLRDEHLRKIAEENNLSETAFTVPWHDDDADYHLRWFTPTTEVALCGHATLAAAHVLIGEREAVRFKTNHAGILTVRRNGEHLVIDMPLAKHEQTDLGTATLAALGVDAELHLYQGPEPLLIVPLEDETTVRGLKPDFAALRHIEALVMITAPSSMPNVDFVSRVFAGAYGIDEDPVTGSAHAGLAAYWTEQTGKTRLNAFQASRRGGRLTCMVEGDRLHLMGRAMTVIEGEFFF